jgi:hypothetical protein
MGLLYGRAWGAERPKTAISGRAEDVAGIKPIDPDIGLLRLNRACDGTTLAAVYNFACHPILGVPSEANTADLTGYSSLVIEENLGSGAIAIFLQGCA